MFTIALLLLVFSVFAIGFPAALLGLEGRSALIASFIGSIVGLILAFVLIRRRANAMIRVLKFEYGEIEREFRLLFKNNNIQFNRKTEDDAFRYDFPGHNLSMAIQPYPLLNEVEDDNNWVLPATKITLGDLNAKNEAFAEQLAVLIDGMEKQRADSA